MRLMFSVDMQSERILAWGFTPNILQILHLQSCGAVWLTLLLVQNEELALLHAGILLLCQHPAASGSLGVSRFAYLS